MLIKDQEQNVINFITKYHKRNPHIKSGYRWNDCNNYIQLTTEASNHQPPITIQTVDLIVKIKVWLKEHIKNNGCTDCNSVL